MVDGRAAVAVPASGEAISQVPPVGVATETAAVQPRLAAPSGRSSTGRAGGLVPPCDATKLTAPGSNLRRAVSPGPKTFSVTRTLCTGCAAPPENVTVILRV